MDSIVVVSAQPQPPPGGCVSPFSHRAAGIPVGEIDRNWCKTTEFTEEIVLPRLFLENGTPTIAYDEYGASRSRIRNTSTDWRYPRLGRLSRAPRTHKLPRSGNRNDARAIGDGWQGRRDG